MNRRLFFRAFAGVPVAATAKVLPSPKDEIAIGSSDVQCAGCGASLFKRRLVPTDYDSPLFVICEFTPECPHRGKALIIPKLTFSTVQADPAVVAAVLAEEVAQARERLLAQEAEMAKFQKSLDPPHRMDRWTVYVSG